MIKLQHQEMSSFLFLASAFSFQRKILFEINKKKKSFPKIISFSVYFQAVKKKEWKLEARVLILFLKYDFF